ncbi:MAG: amidohydrolase family protein [Anaerolineales bacterium]|jgi:cytosine deaminase
MINFDILIKNCQLRGQPENRFDVGITGGKITALAENLPGAGKTEIDAQGSLVTEAFVNPHLHLCKVYTLPMMDELALQDYHAADMGKAMTAIELAARVKESYDESWIIKNVRKAVALSAIFGGTHIRAFADVDSKARLIGARALIRAREEFKGIVDIQVVAFAQDGIVREPEAAELLRQAMQLGADVVGGIPWIEYTDADIAEHVKTCYDIAEEFDKPVSMLVDDAGDPGLRSLELMTLETIKRGWHGRSLAHHARAMAFYPKPYLQKIIALLKQAQLGVVSDPHTGPLHACVRELLEGGALVSLGMDDISDAYYPFGRNNMLEVAFLVSHLLWMTTRKDMETLYDLITTNAAQCIGLRDFSIKIGAPANIVVLGEPNVLEALRNHRAPDYVISNGKLVDREAMRKLVETQEWPEK